VPTRRSSDLLKGNLTKTWTLPEGTSAMALGVDPRNGQLHIGAWGHIADGVPSGVLVYTRDGAYVRSYVAPVDFTWTGGIAIDSNGTSYVANARDNMIHSFSASGEHLGSFGGTGTDDGQFGQPGDVALGKDGTLYVPDI